MERRFRVNWRTASANCRHNHIRHVGPDQNIHRKHKWLSNRERKPKQRLPNNRHQPNCEHQQDKSARAAHAHADADADADAHAHAHAHAHADADADAHAHADAAHAHAHADSYSDSDGAADANANAHSNHDAFAYSDFAAHGDPYPNRNFAAHGDPYPNRNSQAHRNASADRRTHGDQGSNADIHADRNSTADRNAVAHSNANTISSRSVRRHTPSDPSTAADKCTHHSADSATDGATNGATNCSTNPAPDAAPDGTTKRANPPARRNSSTRYRRRTSERSTPATYQGTTIGYAARRDTSAAACRNKRSHRDAYSQPTPQSGPEPTQSNTRTNDPARAGTRNEPDPDSTRKPAAAGEIPHPAEAAGLGASTTGEPVARHPRYVEHHHQPAQKPAYAGVSTRGRPRGRGRGVYLPLHEKALIRLKQNQESDSMSLAIRWYATTDRGRPAWDGHYVLPSGSLVNAPDYRIVEHPKGYSLRLWNFSAQQHIARAGDFQAARAMAEQGRKP